MQNCPKKEIVQFLTQVKKKAEILLTFCFSFFCTIPVAYLHIFHVLSLKQCENSAEKWTAEFLLFFLLGDLTVLN